MYRRALLTSVAVLLATSGCLGDEDVDFPEPTDPVTAYVAALNAGDFDGVVSTFHPESELQAYADDAYVDAWEALFEDLSRVDLEHVEVNDRDEERAIIGARFYVLGSDWRDTMMGLLIVRPHEDDWFIAQNPPLLPDE